MIQKIRQPNYFYTYAAYYATAAQLQTIIIISIIIILPTQVSKTAYYNNML